MAVINRLMGVAMATLMGVGVAIPIIQDTLASSNVSGTTELILQFIPIGIGASILYLTFSPFMGGGGK